MQINKKSILSQLSEHYAQGNDSLLAKQLGIKPQTLSNWKSRNTIDYELVYTKCIGLNPHWLLTGKGEMLINATNEKVSLHATDLIKTTFTATNSNSDKQAIHFYDTDFAEGEIEFYDDTGTHTPAYTMNIPLFAGCTAFRTYNNDMEKLIHSGDIVFATKESDWANNLAYGHIYGIVCHNNRRYLKYIRKAKGKEKTHFLLKSENKEDYDDFLIAKDEIKSVWLVHGWIKKRT